MHEHVYKWPYCYGDTYRISSDSPPHVSRYWYLCLGFFLPLTCLARILPILFIDPFSTLPIFLFTYIFTYNFINFALYCFIFNCRFNLLLSLLRTENTVDL